MRIIIVSGLSGSGKTIALQTLEDLDYYCVDNLPFKLILPLAREILASSDIATPAVAVGVDARNFIDELYQFPATLAELRASELTVEVLFLQHPNERKMPVNTARLAHLSLAKSRLVHGVSFTPDDAVIRDLLDGLGRFEKSPRGFPEFAPEEERSGGTAFYDAIWHSITGRLAKAQSGRRALLIFSDGEDNSSAHDYLDAVEDIWQGLKKYLD